jgi:hypothetical protein
MIGLGISNNENNKLIFAAHSLSLFGREKEHFLRRMRRPEMNKLLGSLIECECERAHIARS